MTGSRNMIYITANWAEGTKICVPGERKSIAIQNPWSCIYTKHHDSNWVNNLREIRNKNLEKGLGFSFLKGPKTKIWHAVKVEHLQQICIEKPNPLAYPIAHSPGDVRAESMYVPNDQRSVWVETNITFNDNLPDNLLGLLKGNFDFPTKESIETKDKFFGLCLGHREEGQLLANDHDEKCRRLGVHIDNECEDLRNQDAHHIAKLTYYLQNPQHGLPGQLGHFNGRYKFFYSDDCPFYNLYPLSEDPTQAVWVAYQESESQAKKLANELKKVVGADQWHKVCIFYDGISQIRSLPPYDERYVAATRTPPNETIDRLTDMHDFAVKGVKVDGRTDSGNLPDH
ncbi:hypothetical protein BSNK01_18800 [Bacillaceae bacterium]